MVKIEISIDRFRELKYWINNKLKEWEWDILTSKKTKSEAYSDSEFNTLRYWIQIIDRAEQTHKEEKDGLKSGELQEQRLE